MTSSVRLFLALAVLGLVATSVGCARQEATPTQSPIQTPVAESTDSATQAFESPLEEPTAVSETGRPSCLELIEPEGNTVCGYVVHADTGDPITGRPVFLAEAVFSDDNRIVLAALDRERAPQGTTNENGMFYVKDVPADLYFLQLDEYPKPIMLHDPENPSDDLIVDWRDDGGVVGLGVIPARVLEP